MSETVYECFGKFSGCLEQRKPFLFYFNIWNQEVMHMEIVSYVGLET
jgi:hypothetical protein